MQGAQFCANCGKTLSQFSGQQLSNYSVASSIQVGMASIQNTSGQGERSIVPDEIKGWNWGAFLLGWIWGVSNNVWISLLELIPGLGLIVWIVLGIFGNEWAWKYKRWDSVESFKKTQRKWAIAGLIVVCIAGLLFILGLIIAAGQALQPFSDMYKFFKELEPWLKESKSG